jgi:hypothetical protein
MSRAFGSPPSTAKFLTSLVSFPIAKVYIVC